MGEAAETLVIESTENTIVRKRPLKPLKGAGQPSTSNVIALRTLQQEADTKLRTKTARIKTKNATRVPALPYALVESTPAKSAINEQASASNDSVFPHASSVSHSTFSRAHFANRNTLAVAVLAAITIGAVLGNTGSSNEVNVQAQAADGTRLLPPLVAQNLDSLPTVPPIDPVAQELEAAHTAAERYLQAVVRLQAQNTGLIQEVAALESESTSLNLDLLHLELAIVARDAQVETQTVYNYVNVPIGGDLAKGTTYDQSYSYDYYDEGFIEAEEDDLFSEGFVSQENQEQT